MRVLLFLIVLLGGCNLPNLDVEPRVVPGTGETEFVPLTPDVDDLVMTPGVQGGIHVWGAARVTGIDWREITMTWRLLDDDGVEVIESTSIRQQLQLCTQNTEGCEPGMGEIVSVTVVLDDPAGVRGDELTMEVFASDEAGREATATSRIRPVTEVVVE